MIKCIWMLPVILLTGSGIEAQDTTATKANQKAEKTLVAHERMLQEAVVKADKASFLSLVLPSDGVWTTKQGFVLMKDLAGGLDHFHVTKWEILNPRVTFLSDDSAIVTYVWTGTGTIGSQPLAPITLASTVWTRRDGKWLAVHHQETDLVKN